MSSKSSRASLSPAAASNADIVAVALLDREEMANLKTGFKRLYALPDRGDFDDLLMAIERASRPGQVSRDWIR